MSNLADVNIQIDPSDVLDQISVEEIVEYYGEDLLDVFGKDAVIEYFEIEEAE